MIGLVAVRCSACSSARILAAAGDARDAIERAGYEACGCGCSGWICPRCRPAADAAYVLVRVALWLALLGDAAALPAIVALTRVRPGSVASA